MRICFLGSDLTYKGGIQNLSSNLIAHMSHEADVDEILVVCDEVDEPVFKSLRHDKLRIRCVGRPRKSDLPRIALRNINYGLFSKEMDKFDVVHVLDDRALPIVAPLANQLVVTIHDIMMHEFFIQVKNIGSAGLKNLPRFVDHYCPQLLLEFLSIARSDRIIVNSPIVAERLKKSYGNMVIDKIRIIPPGFDPRRFNPNFMSRTQARQRLGLDLSAKMLLHVGGDKTSSRRKGLPYVLHALDDLYKTGQLDNLNVFLFIVGGFPEKWMQQFPHLRKYILQKSYVSDDLMPTVYRAADVFVMASTSEGWGIALIEALACGAPVIASRNVPSAFATEATGAVHIEPNVNDSRQFANSILKELTDNDLQDRDWNKIFDFLVLNFSWKNICKSLLRVYEEIVDDAEHKF